MTKDYFIKNFESEYFVSQKTVFCQLVLKEKLTVSKLYQSDVEKNISLQT